MHTLEITISVTIPVVVGQPDYALGYEAMAKGVAAASRVVSAIEGVGLKDVTITKRIYEQALKHAAE